MPPCLKICIRSSSIRTKAYCIVALSLQRHMHHGILFDRRLARNINNHSYFYKKKHLHTLIYQVEIRKSAKFYRILCKLMVIWELERASSSIEMQIESSACPLQSWASLASYISILLQLNPVKLFFLTKFGMNKQAMRLIFP